MQSSNSEKAHRSRIRPYLHVCTCMHVPMQGASRAKDLSQRLINILLVSSNRAEYLSSRY